MPDNRTHACFRCRSVVRVPRLGVACPACPACGAHLYRIDRAPAASDRRAWEEMEARAYEQARHAYRHPLNPRWRLSD